MNRLAPWSNDPVSDAPGEVIYLRDTETGAIWTPTPLPLGDPTIVSGQGYSRHEAQSRQLHQELTVHVPLHDTIKIMSLRLHNIGRTARHLSATYFAEWELGTHRENAAMQVVCEHDVISWQGTRIRPTPHEEIPEHPPDRIRTPVTSPHEPREASHPSPNSGSTSMTSLPDTMQTQRPSYGPRLRSRSHPALGGLPKNCGSRSETAALLFLYLPHLVVGLCADQMLRMTRDHHFLVGWDDPGRRATTRSADGWAAFAIGTLVELYAEPSRIAAYALADGGAVFANAGGEYQRIQASQRSRKRPQFAPDAIDEKIDGELRPWIVRIEQLAHVARYAGDTKQTRLAVEQLLDGARVHVPLIQ
jgi:Glycosyltransferase family 36